MPKISRVRQTSEKANAKSSFHDNKEDEFIRSLTFGDVDNILVIVVDETTITTNRPFYKSFEEKYY